jgi:hypothetical protein
MHKVRDFKEIIKKAFDVRLPKQQKANPRIHRRRKEHVGSNESMYKKQWEPKSVRIQSKHINRRCLIKTRRSNPYVQL